MVECISNPDEFIELLQKRWAHLFFSRVNSVVIKGKPLSTHYHMMFNDGKFPLNNLNSHEYEEFKEKGTYVDAQIKYEHEVEKVWTEHAYSEFYGFCHTGPIPGDDLYFKKILSLRSPLLHTTKFNHGKPLSETVFFHSGQYSSLDFHISSTSWFGETLNTTRLYNPPKEGDLICGIVERTQKGLSFNRWFICTKEFYCLWKLIMFGYASVSYHRSPGLSTEDILAQNKELIQHLKGFPKYKLKYNRKGKYTKEFIIKNYDPDLRRFEGFDNYRGWGDIVTIFLRCSQFKPFQRKFLPPLTEEDRELIQRHYRPASYRFKPWMEDDDEKRKRLTELENELDEARKMDTCHHKGFQYQYNDCLLITTLRQLRRSQVLKFSDFMDSKRYHIDQIIHY